MFAQSLIEYGALTGALDRAMQSASDLISSANPRTVFMLGGIVVVVILVWTLRR